MFHLIPPVNSATSSTSHYLSHGETCWLHIGVTFSVALLYCRSSVRRVFLMPQVWGGGDNVWSSGATSAPSPPPPWMNGLNAAVALLQQEIVACDKAWKRCRTEKATLEQRVRSLASSSINTSIRSWGTSTSLGVGDFCPSSEAASGCLLFQPLGWNIGICPQTTSNCWCLCVFVSIWNSSGVCSCQGDGGCVC